MRVFAGILMLDGPMFMEAGVMGSLSQDEKGDWLKFTYYYCCLINIPHFD